MPPKLTDDTIKKGVRNCASMVCYPLKTTMGNYIEALDSGANTLLAYDTKGRCRFRQYNRLHSFSLVGLGYDFEMHVINPRNIISMLSKVSGKSRLRVIRGLYQAYQRMKKNDEQKWSDDEPNIGLIGEIYVMNNEEVNFNLEEKIRGYGCNPFNTATATNFIRDKIPLFNPFKYLRKDPKKKYKERAMKFLNGPVGGHAVENLYNLLELVDRNVGGVIHIAPMTCTAEICIEPYVDHICKGNKKPLLRIPIDENSAEKNLETRIEIFTELIKDKKKRGV